MATSFSGRTQWLHSGNPVTNALEARRAAGLPVIDLTETNPTRVGLEGVPAGLLAQLSVPAVERYEPEPFGGREARLAVSQYHQSRVSAEHVCLTASTSEAYSWIFKLLCDPGDQILVPAPSYPLFAHLAQLESVRLATYPTRSWDDWSIDFDALRAALDSNTRGIILVSPNNPTGALLHTSDLPQLDAICAEHDLALISDEVFADYAAPRADRVPSLAGHDAVLTFVLSGLSKVCLTPQLKVGWMAVSGPDRRRNEALQRLEIIADSFLSVNTPAQHALPSLVAARDRIQAPLQQRLRRNRLLLAEALAESPATLLPADGGWSAVLQVPLSRSDEEWALELFHQRGLLVHPGYFFDFSAGSWLVLSLLPEERVFAPAAHALGVLLAG
jgi:aspartate/methionine/tyrosine aminotransferase